MGIPQPEDIVKEYGRINALLSILKLNDEEAYKHCIEVAHITKKYLQIEEKSKSFIKRTEQEQVDILKGALLHDVGKAFLPFSLQFSSKKLGAAELEVLKIHPVLGKIAVEECGMSDIVNNIILLHHCAYDDTGYPTKESPVFPKDSDGNPIEIPSYVWIVSYADKYDAMIHRRSFKEPKTLKETWEEFQHLSFEKKLPYQPMEIFRELMMQDDLFSNDY